jgi:hypothetical protein
MPQAPTAASLNLAVVSFALDTQAKMLQVLATNLRLQTYLQDAYVGPYSTCKYSHPLRDFPTLT